MTGRLFKPAAVVRVAGQQIRNVNQDGLRISFRVNRSMSSTPDTAEIVVYNLSEQRANVMLSRYVQSGQETVELETGYDGTTIRLFRGDVRKLRTVTSLPGADVPTIITADDGGEAIAEAEIRVSTIGITVRNQVDLALAAFARAGHQITEHPSVSSVIATAPVMAQSSLIANVSIGTAAQLLDEAARTIGARWWIRDQTLYMARRGLPTDGIGIRLPRSHWLELPSEDADGIVRLSTFLDPTITPGRLLILQGRTSSLSEETMRVETCQYLGDTESTSPWRVSIVARRTT